MQIRKYVVDPLQNNDYLCYDEETKKAFLVDASTDVQQIVDDIHKLGLELEYIILTHGHFDHINGVPFFQKAFPEAKLAAGKKEHRFLYERDFGRGPGGLIADIQIVDGMELECGNIRLKFIETPGHSVGGICILADKVLFSGDTLFQCSVGRSDFPTGNFDELMDSIKNKLFLLPDDTRVLPGHNDETTIGFEKRYNPFV